MFRLNDPKVKRLILIAAIALSLLLWVLGWLFLPDTLAMQISANGSPGTTMPKAIGLSVSCALCLVFAVVFYRSKDSSLKDMLGVFIGFAAYLLTFLFNL